jgi:hypothetical protein
MTVLFTCTNSPACPREVSMEALSECDRLGWRAVCSKCLCELLRARRLNLPLRRPWKAVVMPPAVSMEMV